MDYDWVFEKGYADFDSQSECEDFIRWAIDEIVQLRKDKEELKLNQCQYQGYCDK
jgi:hypothetical protein